MRGRRLLIFMPLITAMLFLFSSCRRGGEALNGGGIIDISQRDHFVYVGNDNVKVSNKLNDSDIYKFDIIDNIRYADYDKKNADQLSLNFYKPNSTSRRPIIIYIHSGGFISGSKDGYVATKYCNDLAQSGYNVASVDYRLLSSISFLDDVKTMASGESFVKSKIFTGICDIKAAIRFLLANSAIYNIDEENIFLAGYSAGAIAALHIAFSDFEEINGFINGESKDEMDYNYPRYIGQHDIDVDNKYAINGVVALAGGMFKANHIDAVDSIPTLLIHGEKDAMVPYLSGKPFAKYVKQYKLDLPGLYYEMGITKMREEGSSENFKIEGVDVSIKLPKSIVKILHKMIVLDVYGSKTVFDQCQGYCKLITIKDGDHVFMRGSNGEFNQSYYDTKEIILDFIKLNIK